jgi:hypothetical protein
MAQEKNRNQSDRNFQEKEGNRERSQTSHSNPQREGDERNQSDENSQNR